MPKTIDAERSCGGGDVFNPGCPSRAVLEMLAEKWALLVVHTLANGPARTSQLRRQVGGISEKMLIQTLRRLERNGFVSRRAYPEVPPRVEYSLTALGASLSEPITTLDRRKPSSRHRNGAARIRPTRRMMAARIRCLAVGRPRAR
jgi:DNA-binding HxlR family transcriptional regulator